ncbi:MAG: magnesium/cobalt transporter CorA [Gammaproteobacteria bacterium]|nr:magnesium/cobalt transporter CorA [Gammaproteobacteria bacterium]
MLVNCVAYRDGFKLADISPEEISDYLDQPNTFVWVALADATDTELLQMQEEFDLHELAVEDARHGHQRAKIEEYGDSVFAVMQTVEVEESGELYVGEVDVFVGLNYVLSIRSRTHRGFSDVRARCEREPHLLKFGAGFVFYVLMDTVVDRYFPVLDGLEEELDSIEADIFNSGNARTNIEALYALKQKLTILKHATFPLMEAAGKLYGGRVPQVCMDTQEYFRDIYDHLYRINQSIDGIRDMLLTAIQVNLSLIALGESEVNKKLAAWAAIIGVPTMIAGIYGMNFNHMPELEWYWGYPLVMGIMISIDVYLFWRFKKVGWL